MADVIYVIEPEISYVVLDPEAVKVNKTGKIRVKVEEKIVKTLVPLPFAAGEIAAGEA